MRVLHVIPAIAARYGGPSAAIKSMCESLSKIGTIQVELATTDADGPNGRIEPGSFDFGFPVHVFPRVRSEQWKYSPELGKWLQSNVAHFSIVHLHALWSYSTYAGSRASIGRRVPYIIRPAGMFSEFSLRQGAWKKWAYWRLIEGATTKCASAFHATSAEEKAEVLQRLPNAQVRVIANGIDNSSWAFPSTKAIDDGQVRAAGSIPTILFLSRLHPKKGIVDRLIPAFELLQTPARLVIAGGTDPHDPGHAEQVRARVSVSPKARDIALVGESKGDARWAAYDSADLFVLPSHSENFGIVVAEAMSRGCPIVITREVQSGSHLLASRGGSVVAGKAAEIASAIDQILLDPVAALEMGSRGQAYSRQHFAWDAIATQIKTMYDSVLSSSSTKPPAE